MEKSAEIKEIAKALSLFQLKCDKIKKDANNPFFKSKYATLSNILDVIQLPLQECGLTFSQMPDNDNLTTILIHVESGQYFQSEYCIHAAKVDPQGIGSAITYARRYALSAILGLNVDDDDDANSATHGGVTPQKAADNLPWLNKTKKDGTITDEWKKVEDALKSKKCDLAYVQSKYKLSKENKQELEIVVNYLNK